jgi:chromosome segregation ATPase
VRTSLKFEFLLRVADARSRQRRSQREEKGSLKPKGAPFASRILTKSTATMTTWTIPVRENAIEQASNYEDQYHKLKSERDETAHRLNALEDANRILRTKCALLETFKKKVVDGEVNKDQLAASAGSASKQDKSSYDDLFKAFEIVKRQHRSTIAKNKSYLQHIGKLKKEIQTLKLRCGAPRLKNYSASNSIVNKVEKIEVPVATVDNKENVERASVNTVLEQLQSRLNDAEAQLSALKSKPLVAESITTNVRYVSVVVVSSSSCHNKVYISFHSHQQGGDSDKTAFIGIAA